MAKVFYVLGGQLCESEFGLMPMPLAKMVGRWLSGSGLRVEIKEIEDGLESV